MTSPLNPSTPKISIVIAVRATGDSAGCIAAIENSKFALEQIEIVVVAGNNPSAQRNQGAAEARGEVIYFLDDDSVVHPRALQTLLQAFEDYPGCAGVGGPSVQSSGGSLFQKCASMAMGSLFGFGPARHRYYPSGCPRPGGDNELILSNLAIRRSAWRENAGFDPRLYPNEENEFIGRLERRGYRFLYHPGVWVFRHARENLWALLNQVFRYGRSRSHHIRIAQRPVNALMVIPSTLVLYLLASGYIAASGGLVHSQLFFPLYSYAGLTVAASVYAGLSVRSRRLGTVLWSLVVFPTIHLGYGVGMICGFLIPTPTGQLNSKFQVLINAPHKPAVGFPPQ